MSRVIKFRALYDDMGGGWRYGMLIYEGEVPRIQQEGTMLFSTCLKGTEGQFTGLLDKSGVEIYEGDVIAQRGQPNTFVEYDRGKWVLRNDEKGVEWRQELHNKFYLHIEVIGNKFQHPELLSIPIKKIKYDSQR